MIPTQKGGASLPPGDGFPAYMDKLMEKAKAIRRELAKKISFKPPRNYRRDSLRRPLRFCGLTYHQPAKVNRKQNPHLVRRFEDKLKKDSSGMPVKMVWYW